MSLILTNRSKRAGAITDLRDHPLWSNIYAWWTFDTSGTTVSDSASQQPSFSKNSATANTSPTPLYGTYVWTVDSDVVTNANCPRCLNMDGAGLVSNGNSPAAAMMWVQVDTSLMGSPPTETTVFDNPDGIQQSAGFSIGAATFDAVPWVSLTAVYNYDDIQLGWTEWDTFAAKTCQTTDSPLAGLNLSDWHLIGWQLNSTPEWEIWVNGVQSTLSGDTTPAATKTMLHQLQNTTQDIDFGHFKNFGSVPAYIHCNAIGIFNKALSSDEWLDLYNSGAGLFPS